LMMMSSTPLACDLFRNIILAIVRPLKWFEYNVDETTF
jgi:hypothetical protein